MGQQGTYVWLGGLVDLLAAAGGGPLWEAILLAAMVGRGWGEIVGGPERRLWCGHRQRELCDWERLRVSWCDLASEFEDFDVSATSRSGQQELRAVFYSAL